MESSSLEVWKDIPGYEGLYEVSNLGRVLSLSRRAKNKNGFRNTPEKILKPGNRRGYLQVVLSKDSISKTRNIHQLVAEAFLNHKPCGFKLVINHKNFDKSDNRLSNLEIVTHRENTNKKHLKRKSIYTGVYWVAKNKKWESKIQINGKSKYIGYFQTEYEAHLAYQETLTKLKDQL